MSGGVRDRLPSRSRRGKALANRRSESALRWPVAELARMLAKGVLLTVDAGERGPW